MTRQASSIPTSLVTDASAYETSELLDRLLAEVNERYFGGRINVRIVWGVPVTRACVGDYPHAASPVPPATYHRDGLLLVHVFLQKKKAPQYVLRYLIYHECVHQIVPWEPGKDPHPPEFLEWERQAPHAEAAKRWLSRYGFPVLQRC